MKMDFLKELELNLKYYFSTALNLPLVKPDWVFISVSHRCNFDCQMCAVKKVLKNVELDLVAIKRSLDEVAGWNSNSTVLLTGGEPFLRKDIFEIIDYSVSKGLKTEVVTNGSLIDAQMAEKIVGSGLKNIAVSLDGARSETHDAIRRVKGAHKKALEALFCLSEEKRRIGSGPQISAWVTMMSENLDELYDIIPLAKQAGVECLVYHPVVVTQDDMQNTIKEGSLWVKTGRLEKFKKQIDKIVAYQKKNGLVVFLHDPYLWLDYFQGKLTKQQWKCNPFVFVDIGPDGFVRSCGPAFGNIQDMSLTACFETQEAQKARERMKRCQRPCLQTCWARPEADFLKSVIDVFLSKVDSLGGAKADKKSVIEKGIALLDQYEVLALKK